MFLLDVDNSSHRTNKNALCLERKNFGSNCRLLSLKLNESSFLIKNMYLQPE